MKHIKITFDPYPYIFSHIPYNEKASLEECQGNKINNFIAQIRNLTRV